jgi:hypothetical protein
MRQARRLASCAATDQQEVFAISLLAQLMLLLLCPRTTLLRRQRAMQEVSLEGLAGWS